MKNWKTTVAGLLSGIASTAGPVAAYLAESHSPKAASTAGLVALVAVVSRIWVGLIQADAKPSVTSSVTIEQVNPIPKKEQSNG